MADRCGVPLWIRIHTQNESPYHPLARIRRSKPKKVLTTSSRAYWSPPHGANTLIAAHARLQLSANLYSHRRGHPAGQSLQPRTSHCSHVGYTAGSCCQCTTSERPLPGPTLSCPRGPGVQPPAPPPHAPCARQRPLTCPSKPHCKSIGAPSHVHRRRVGEQAACAKSVDAVAPVHVSGRRAAAARERCAAAAPTQRRPEPHGLVSVRQQAGEAGGRGAVAAAAGLRAVGRRWSRQPRDRRSRQHSADVWAAGAARLPGGQRRCGRDAAAGTAGRRPAHASKRAAVRQTAARPPAVTARTADWRRSRHWAWAHRRHHDDVADLPADMRHTGWVQKRMRW
eukprot:249922-Chlamydomonas_euryale.AAC.2